MGQATTDQKMQPFENNQQKSANPKINLAQEASSCSTQPEHSASSAIAESDDGVKMTKKLIRKICQGTYSGERSYWLAEHHRRCGQSVPHAVYHNERNFCLARPS